MESAHFVSNLEEIRKNARQHIEQGAITEGYSIDKDTVIELLNTALATEIVCTLRYKQHYYMCQGLNAQSAAAEFLEHANQEQQHADQLAERIAQLGGEPDMNPGTLIKRSHSEFAPAGTIKEMVTENLVAERIAIDSYREMIEFLGDKDPTTRRMLEEILAVEEEHADDLADLLTAA
jgi:bacterioferritin